MTTKAPATQALILNVTLQAEAPPTKGKDHHNRETIVTPTRQLCHINTRIEGDFQGIAAAESLRALADMIEEQRLPGDLCKTRLQREAGPPEEEEGEANARVQSLRE